MWYSETMPLADEQLQKFEVCKNKLVRRITKNVRRRRTNDLIGEVGMQFSLTGSRTMWAGHLVRMEGADIKARRCSEEVRSQGKGNTTVTMVRGMRKGG